MFAMRATNITANTYKFCIIGKNHEMCSVQEQIEPLSMKCATLRNTTKCVLLKSTSLKRILNPGWLKIDRAVCNTHASILYDLCTGWIGFCLTCYLGCLMLYLSDSLFDALFKWFFVWVILCIIDSLLGWFIDDSKEILDMFLTSCVCVWRYIIFALISHYICWW